MVGSMTLTGFEFLEVYRAELTAVQFRNAMKKAVLPGAELFKKVMKQNVPKQHGTFELSIVSKIKGYTKSGTAVAIVGPLSEFKLAEPPKGRIEQPSKIAHLLERGHKIRGGGGFVSGIWYTKRTNEGAQAQALNMAKDAALDACIAAANRAARKAEKMKQVIA